jgi:hypothetical protein
LEANPEEMKSVAGQEKAPKEAATVETGRALNEWHREWNLAVGCSGKTKEQTQGNGGSQKKLAAVAGKMLHQEPRKDEHTRTDVGTAQNATMA